MQGTKHEHLHRKLSFSKDTKPPKTKSKVPYLLSHEHFQTQKAIALSIPTKTQDEKMKRKGTGNQVLANSHDTSPQEDAEQNPQLHSGVTSPLPSLILKTREDKGQGRTRPNEPTKS